MIVRTTLFAALLAAGVSLLLPRSYRSEASVLPPDAGSTQLDIAGILQGAGIVQPARLPTMSSPSDIYVAILESRTTRFGVIDSLDLVSAYDVETREEAYEILSRRCRIEVTSEGVIRVSAEDRSADRAAAIANGHVRRLDRFNQETSIGRARRTREFVQKRIAETTDELRTAEETLRDFQETSGVIALPEQSSASIEAAAAIWERITEFEVLLAATAGSESEDSPSRVRTRAQIRELELRLARLEQAPPARTPGEDGDSALVPHAFIALQEAPDLALRYGRLLQEVEIKRTVLQYLMEKYEEARIQEARDIPTLQLLDVAMPSPIPFRPRRKVFVVVVTGLAFLFSITWAFLLTRWEGIDKDSREAEEWRHIRDSLAADLHLPVKSKPEKPEDQA